MEPDRHGAVGGAAWQLARVIAITSRTTRIKSFFFSLPQPAVFVPGQHMDVRLTAPDGYHAERSYSIASAPEDRSALELAIERLQDGEVSPFFHDEVRVGDEIELRGPIGGHFVWSVEDGGPVLLIGGGSGLVPLISMIRHHAARESGLPLTLVACARTSGELLCIDELRSRHAARSGFSLLGTVTREAPTQPDLRSGRIDRDLLCHALDGLGSPTCTFVCGANPFVERVTQLLLDLDVPADRIRTERYGA